MTRNYRQFVLGIATVGMLALSALQPSHAAIRFTTPGAGTDYPGDVCTYNNAIYIAGSMDGGLANRTDVLLARYAPPGLRLWRSRYLVGLGTVDRVVRVIASADYVYVIGTVDFRAGNKEDIFVACFKATNGAFVAVDVFSGPGGGPDVPTDVAFDAAGNLFVLGYAEMGPTKRDVVMSKYASPLALTSRTTWDAGLNLNDVSSTMVRSGLSLHVIGTSENGAANTDYSYLVFDTVTNTVLSSALVDFGMNDKGVDISVDPVGTYLVGNVETALNGTDIGIHLFSSGGPTYRMVYHRYAGAYEDTASGIESNNWNWCWVSGSSQTPASGYDYTVIAPTTYLASIQWSAFYNGPGNGDDLTSQLIVDTTLGVFVTGKSYGGAAAGDDYATGALDVVTGASIWAGVNRYDWAGLDDGARRMAVHPTNGVFVHGGSMDAGSSLDFATQRLTLAAGADLW